MSATPLVDRHIISSSDPWLHAETARGIEIQLRQELAAANERIESVSSALKRTTAKLNDATQDAASWRAYAERLEKAGETMATWAPQDNRRAFWTAAKKTKP